MISRLKKALSSPRAKRYVAAGVFVVFVAAMLHTTFAWLVSSDFRNNQLGIIPFIFSQRLKEEFDRPSGGSYLLGGDVVDKKNWVENDGDIAAFVRVKVFPVLADSKGVHQEAQFGKQLAYVGLNTTHWQDGGDGYFYYMEVLPPGASTPPLFEKVALDGQIVAEGSAELSVTLIAETVETRKYYYREAWWNNTIPAGAEAIDSTLADKAE